MAKRVVVELVDDINGQSGATTTRFNLDGADYEIDLVDDRPLRELLAPYIAAARPTNSNGKPGPATGRRNGAPRRRHDLHLIRRWAAANGITLPARGRIPAATINAYDDHIRSRTTGDGGG
ncbi:histone-like nucleoid-structuring protein Lsr2 [Mycobacterium xenopi]|uniref:histone-like nucleoid-structuring protein Lsr2 n=1 Tax=Mycobacterium xenopi TaxID=1789 RepID=UPI0022EB807F|nr:Lsr2 family protein [Mycobacterium xenopi]MDA3659997.1 Lsr2 family protein [Mycobacterium xenopi]